MRKRKSMVMRSLDATNSHLGPEAQGRYIEEKPSVINGFLQWKVKHMFFLEFPMKLLGINCQDGCRDAHEASIRDY